MKSLTLNHRAGLGPRQPSVCTPTRFILENGARLSPSLVDMAMVEPNPFEASFRPRTTEPLPKQEPSPVLEPTPAVSATDNASFFPPGILHSDTMAMTAAAATLPAPATLPMPVSSEIMPLPAFSIDAFCPTGMFSPATERALHAIMTNIPDKPADILPPLAPVKPQHKRMTTPPKSPVSRPPPTVAPTSTSRPPLPHISSNAFIYADPSGKASASHPLSQNPLKRPSSPPTSPSGRDEETPEQKRQRFLERNRIAASKCRNKRKAWINDLEETARRNSEENRLLHEQLSALTQELHFLRAQVATHHHCACSAIHEHAHPKV